MNTTTTPLSNIRTDVVGSLLRPAHLKQAYAQRDEGKISEEELHRIEDDAIRDAVRLQESLGLDVITDGEYRRLNFQDSFAASVSGFAARHVDLSFMESLSREGKPLQRWDPYHVADGAAILQRRPVSQKLRLTRNLPLEEYRFVSAVAQKPAKVTLVGPDRITQRFDYQNSKSVYWSTEDFVADVVRIEREMIRSLIDAGCRYIQIDAPSYTAYVDAPSLDEMKERGEDPMKNLMRSIKADNEIFASFRWGHVWHSLVPRQPTQHVAPRRKLRRDRGGALRWPSTPSVFARIRQSARWYVRTAAFCPERKGRRLRACQH